MKSQVKKLNSCLKWFPFPQVYSEFLVIRKKTIVSANYIPVQVYLHEVCFIFMDLIQPKTCFLFSSTLFAVLSHWNSLLNVVTIWFRCSFFVKQCHILKFMGYSWLVLLVVCCTIVNFMHARMWCVFLHNYVWWYLESSLI